jgi:hypothetical protein
MDVSPEDAFALLHKWYEERTPVNALFVSADSVAIARLSGFVNSPSPERGILISPGDVDEMSSYLRIDISEAVGFDYMEAKDLREFSDEERERLAQKHGHANLRIRFSTGSRLSLFETS